MYHSPSHTYPEITIPQRIEMKLLFLLGLLPALFTVGVSGDLCKVTHQDNKTNYKIVELPSNRTCDISWVDFNNNVLEVKEVHPHDGSISFSLTLTECLENVSATIECYPEYSKTYCTTDCTAAPEPEADSNAAPEPEEHIDPIPGMDYGILVAIAVVIVVAIALVCCRKKGNSGLEWFKRVCSSNKPQSGEEADGKPEDIPMLDVYSSGATPV